MTDNNYEASFDAAFETFMAGVAKISDDYYGDEYPNLEPSIFGFNKGRRYMKVTVTTVPGDGKSVHCFVDRTNGDVLKPAGWNAPAKHARGNIFDDNNGLGAMGPHGPAYLRR